MFHHQIYAQIKNERVLNICVCDNYEIANQVARNLYGKDAIAIECTYWDCEINDIYRCGAFYDSFGNMREYKGSEAEKIDILKRQISLDNDTILDLMYENDLLKDQIEEDNDSILDLDYRVCQLEDNMEV